MQQMNEGVEIQNGSFLWLLDELNLEQKKEKYGEKSSGGWLELGVMRGGSHGVEGYENKGY